MSLIARYKLDNNARDEVGDNNGVIYGSPTSESGKVSGAYNFNGSSDYISAPGVSDMLDYSPEASISMWVKKDSIQYGLVQLSGFESTNGNLYPYDTETKVYLDIFRTDRLGPIYMNSSVLEWHHFVVTQKPGEWKLYQNGNLIHTAGANNYVRTNYSQFEIGRNSNSRYADGSFNDVRVYDHALSIKEIKELSKAKVLHYKFDYDDTIITDSSEQGNDGIKYNSPTYSDGKIGKGAYSFNGTDDYIRTDKQVIGVSNELTISGWMYPLLGGSNYRCALHHGNDTSVGGSSYWFGVSAANNLTATIGANTGVGWSAGETATPVVYDEWVHISATWDGTTVKVYINGQYNKQYPLSSYNVLTTPIRIGASSDGISYQYAGKVDDVRVYTNSLSEEEIKEIYQQRASIDSKGNFNSHIFETNGFKSSVVDYSGWQIGATYSPGSGGSYWGRNGAPDENIIITKQNPVNQLDIVWATESNSPSSESDGGWNTDSFPIDNSKTYRFSCWIRRENAGTGDGTTYFGTHAYGSVNGINYINGASYNTNPYFRTEGSGLAPYIDSKWTLWVAYVVASDTPSEPTYITDTKGVWNTDGVRVSNSCTTFMWNPESTSANFRSYLYYSTKVDERQYWYRPRVDIIDGNEPSIDELVNCATHRPLINSSGEFVFNDNKITSSGISKQIDISEIGITQGLIGWWKLDGDTLDYSINGNDGVNNGAVVSDGLGQRAYDFNGVDTKIDIPEFEVSQGKTISLWVYTRSSLLKMPFGKYDTDNYFSITNSKYQMQDNDNANIIWNSPVKLNEWIYVTLVSDGVNWEVFEDGVSLGKEPIVGSFYVDTIGTGYTASQYYFDGKIQDIRIYNRALTSKEILVNYKMTDPNKEERVIKGDNGEMFIKGQISEVNI